MFRKSVKMIQPSKDEFRLFYQRNFKPLAAHLARLGANTTEIEDITQDSFTESYLQWNKIRDESKRKSWLFTVARRKFFKSITNKNYWTELDCDTNQSESSDTERQAILNESVHSIKSLISSLRPPEKQQIVGLFYFEGYTISEITEITGIKTSTITTWLSRFREKAEIQDNPFKSNEWCMEVKSV